MSLLGFDAIGRWALGQQPNAGSAVLIASPGSYVLSGVAAKFAEKLTAAAGSYVVAGSPATFKGSIAAAAGSYLIAGVAASINADMQASAGAYVLSGQPASEKVAFATAPGIYGIVGNSTALSGAFDADPGSYTIDADTPLFFSSGLLGFGPIGAAALGQTSHGTGVRKNSTSFALVMQAASGSYVINSTGALLVRTGADFDLTYGGIGHYLVAAEEARQLARITRKTPAPIDRTTAPVFKPVGSPPVPAAAPVISMQAIQKERAAAQQAADAHAAIIKRRRQEVEFLLLAS